MKLFVCAILAAAHAMASPVFFSAGGTWGTLTGSSAYFASGDTWTLSFQVNNPPSTFNVNTGTPGWFGTTYTNGSYTLNGVTVAMTGSTVYFYTNQSFDICLDSTCTNQLGSFVGSPQLFSGPPDTPTMMTGVFQTTTDGFAASNNNTFLGKTGVVGDITLAGTVPEPATLTLSGAGLLLAGLAYRRRRGSPLTGTVRDRSSISG